MWLNGVSLSDSSEVSSVNAICPPTWRDIVGGNVSHAIV